MLRFFEREGLVVPQRTAGGHRLYGEAEIERLLRLKRLQRDERLSLAEVRERLTAAERLPATSTLARHFLRAALEGRPLAARLLVVRAVEDGLPLVRLHAEVLAPALREVGNRWQAGTLAVSQEHEVSALVRDILGELAARVPQPASPRAVIVAACAPGELHDLGLRMLATELRQTGCAVHYLGANLPPDALASAVTAHRPDLVLLSITSAAHAPALEDAIRTARRAAGASPPRFVVGGQGAAAIASHVSAWGAELAREDTPFTPFPSNPQGRPPSDPSSKLPEVGL
jgi:methanogenic corrinoid protein MtbC1